MRLFPRFVAISIFVLWTVALHAQTNPYKPTGIAERLDQAAQFNGKDRPYILVNIAALLGDEKELRPARLDTEIGRSRDTFSIVDAASNKIFQPAEVQTLGGGIALFGNYEKNHGYSVTILREIPVFNLETSERLGHVPSGVAGKLTWTLEGDTGLDRQRMIEFIPSNLVNTRSDGRSSTFGLDFKLGYTDYLGRDGNAYVDYSGSGNVSPEKELSFNQLQTQINLGYRLSNRSARFEFTNKFQSTQDADQIDYVIGGQAVFLPPLAISSFSKRFAWDPTIKFGYEWAKEVDPGPNDEQESASRLTYGLNWVVPIGDLLAFSVSSTGIIDLVKPVTSKRFHDQSSVGLFLLVHERDQTKLQTVFKYSHGEAAPAFIFNQSVALGLLMQFR